MSELRRRVPVHPIDLAHLVRFLFFLDKLPFVVVILFFDLISAASASKSIGGEVLAESPPCYPGKEAVEDILVVNAPSSAQHKGDKSAAKPKAESPACHCGKERAGASLRLVSYFGHF